MTGAGMSTNEGIGSVDATGTGMFSGMMGAGHGIWEKLGIPKFDGIP
jgi:NAD-dependent SIR2 family protein deacetylase